jgi:SAM-dependent methyltransferase
MGIAAEELKTKLLLDPERGIIVVFAGGRPVGRLIRIRGAFTAHLGPGCSPELAEIVRQEIAEYGTHLQETLSAAFFEIGTAKASRAAAGVVPTLTPERTERVHLGCGRDVRTGWLNIDYRPGSPKAYDEECNFLNFDLRRGVPLADNSVGLFYSSHFLEHLSFAQSLRLVQDCYRCLRPGGIFRAAVPNQVECEAYVRKDEAILAKLRVFLGHMPPFARGFADLLAWAFYAFPHRYVWDHENMPALLRHVGFATAEGSEFDETIDNLSPVRRAYSLYVTAVK